LRRFLTESAPALDGPIMEALTQEQANERPVESLLAQAKELVTAIEKGDDLSTDRLLDEIRAVRGNVLYQKLGQLTRELHDKMLGFAMDSRIADLTHTKIPDARERLNYVITMTQESADTTLNVVEELVPLSAKMGKQSSELSLKWGRFLQREMPYSEFKELSSELSEYFSESKAGIETIQSKLNEVLLAQGFQDVTGQIIRRVIGLVQDVEESMVELIRLSGLPRFIQDESSEQSAEQPMEGPAIPGVEQGKMMDTQDDVDDLLSSLGF